MIAGNRSSSPARRTKRIVQDYPKCWGGSTGGFTCKGDKSVGEVWNKLDRDSVVYYAFNPVCR